MIHAKLIAAVLMFGTGLMGCAPASTRVSESRLPPIEPRVLSSTPTTEALQALGRAKKPGEKNLIFALTFSEPPPKELLSSWGTLDNAFANLANSGIKYLPWDYFNRDNMPRFVPVGSGVMTSGSPAVAVGVNKETGKLDYEVDDGFAHLFEDLKNKDKSPPKYCRLRMALNFDRNVKTMEKGVIIRALANVGQEQVEPSVELSDDSDVGRLTVNLGYVDANGSIGEHNVIVTADVVRIGASDKFGIIISSNGGFYYDKVTVAHGLASAVNETVGHAVFILISKLVGLDEEELMRSARGWASSRVGVDPSATGSGPSYKTFRVVSGGSHTYNDVDSIRIGEIHGNTVVVDRLNGSRGDIDVGRRIHVGDSIEMHDRFTREVRHLRLLGILYETTAEFSETVEPEPSA